MLDLLDRCFKTQMNTPEWKAKLKEMIPSYGQKLADTPGLCDEMRGWTSQVLKLNVEEEVGINN